MPFPSVFHCLAFVSRKQTAWHCKEPACAKEPATMTAFALADDVVMDRTTTVDPAIFCRGCMSDTSHCCVERSYTANPSTEVPCSENSPPTYSVFSCTRSDRTVPLICEPGRASSVVESGSYIAIPCEVDVPEDVNEKLPPMMMTSCDVEVLVQNAPVKTEGAKAGCAIGSGASWLLVCLEKSVERPIFCIQAAGPRRVCPRRLRFGRDSLSATLFNWTPIGVTSGPLLPPFWIVTKPLAPKLEDVTTFPATNCDCVCPRLGVVPLPMKVIVPTT